MHFTKRLLLEGISITALLEVISLSTGPALSQSPILSPVDVARRQKHSVFKKLLPRMQPRLLFVGDSITARWPSIGKAYWDKEFAPRRAFSAGIEGETIPGLLWRIDNGEFEGISPHLALVLIGTNNIGGEPSALARGVIEVANALKSELPETKIVVLGILPRDTRQSIIRSKVEKVNTLLLEQFQKSNSALFYNLENCLLDKYGDFIPGSMLSDNVHLTEKGYGIFGQALLPVILINGG